MYSEFKFYFDNINNSQYARFTACLRYGAVWRKEYLIDNIIYFSVFYIVYLLIVCTFTEISIINLGVVDGSAGCGGHE